MDGEIDMRVLRLVGCASISSIFDPKAPWKKRRGVTEGGAKVKVVK